MGPGARSRKKPVPVPVPCRRCALHHHALHLPLASRGATSCLPRAQRRPTPAIWRSTLRILRNRLVLRLLPVFGRSRAATRISARISRLIDRPSPSPSSGLPWLNDLGPFTAALTDLNQSIYPSPPSCPLRFHPTSSIMDHRSPRCHHHQGVRCSHAPSSLSQGPWRRRRLISASRIVP